MFVKIVPLSNAEKCRHYPRKNLVDRKMLSGRNIKFLFKKAKDIVAKKAHLKIQREKKRLYRDCKIEESCNVATSCFSSSNSSFSGTAVKSRSLSKAANALPKSLHKHSEIVQGLSNKFNLRINFTKRKSDQPENELCEDESSVERLALYW